jgi:hypothetical protein
MGDEENGAHVICCLIECSERKGSFETGLHVVQNLSCNWMPVFIPGVSFPSTAALRHRYPVSAGTSRDMGHAQRNGKRCSFGLKMAVGNSLKRNRQVCLICLIHVLCPVQHRVISLFGVVFSLYFNFTRACGFVSVYAVVCALPLLVRTSSGRAHTTAQSHMPG